MAGLSTVDSYPGYACFTSKVAARRAVQVQTVWLIRRMAEVVVTAEMPMNHHPQRHGAIWHWPAMAINMQQGERNTVAWTASHDHSYATAQCVCRGRLTMKW